MTVSTNQINLLAARLSLISVLSTILERYCVQKILNYILLSKLSLEILFLISSGQVLTLQLFGLKEWKIKS